MTNKDNEFHWTLNIEDRWEQVVGMDSVRTIEEMFEHETETTSMSILLEVPIYLSSIRTEEFQSLLQSIRTIYTMNIDSEKLHSIMILLHQRSVLELEKSLWFLHFKLGTTVPEDIDVPYRYWSERLKQIIRCVSRTTTISDTDKIIVDDIRCENFVRQHLMTIEEAYQTCIYELSKQQHEFVDYHRILEPVCEKFIKERMLALSSDYDHRLQILILNAKRAAVEKNLRMQSFHEQQKQCLKQIFEMKYQHEKAKYEMKLLKDRIMTGHLPAWLTPFYRSLPNPTHIIRNSTHRERFERQQRQILREFQTQIRDLIIDIYETRFHETKHVFESEIDRFNDYYKELDTFEHRNTTIVNKLVDQYLGLIEEKMKTIYSFTLTLRTTQLQPMTGLNNFRSKHHQFDIIDESRILYQPTRTSADAWMEPIDIDIESLVTNDERELALVSEYFPLDVDHGRISDEQEQALSQSLSQLSTDSNEYNDSQNMNNKRQRHPQTREPMKETVSLEQSKPIKSSEHKKIRVEHENLTSTTGPTITIPFYLKYGHRKFDQFWKTINDGEHADQVDMNRLQMCGSLYHQICIKEMKQELWRFYLKMGQGEYHLNPVELQSSVSIADIYRYWPDEVRQAALRTEECIPSTFNQRNRNDEICLNYVENYLDDLENQRKSLEHHYQTLKIDKLNEPLESYVQNVGLSTTTESFKFKLMLTKFDYLDDYLQYQYRQENATMEQLRIEKNIYDLNNQFEKTRCEWTLNRQRILSNQLTNSYEKLEIDLPLFLREFKDMDKRRVYIDQYKHIVETVKTKLMMTRLEMLEYQMEQDRRSCNDETNRTLRNDFTLPNPLRTLTMKRLENLKQRWLSKTRFMLQTYVRHHQENQDSLKTRKSWIQDEPLGFLSNLHIGRHIDHSLTNDQLLLLDRGPSYVSPYQLHRSHDFSTDEHLLTKQYASFQHHLAFICHENHVNLIQMTNLQVNSKQLFQQIFNSSLIRQQHDRSIDEHSMMNEIRLKLNKENLVLRRLADQTNRFYLCSRENFDRFSNDFIRQASYFRELHNYNQACPTETHTFMKQRVDEFNRTLENLFRQKRFNEDTYKRLRFQYDRMKIGYLYFLPMIDDNNDLIAVEPFLSMHQSLTWKLSMYLHQLLHPLVQGTMEKTNFLNQSDFNRKLFRYISDYQRLRSTTRFVKITIHNFDTSITHSSLVDVIGFFLFDNLPTNKYEGLSVDTIKQFMKLFLENNIFYYAKKLYQFERCFPKQMLLSNLLNNIYLSVWERFVFHDTRLKNEFFGRFNNEIFFTWNETKDKLNQFLRDIGNKDRHIEFDIVDGPSITYLDTLVENRQGQLFTCFQQQGKLKHDIIHSYSLPYANGNPIDEHRRWFRSLLMKTVHACTNHEDFQRLRIALEYQYLRHGYSIEFVDDELKRFFSHFNVDHARYVIDQLDFSQLRRRCFDYIDNEQYFIKQYWQSSSNRSLLKFYYLYEHGSYEEFNEKFRQLWDRYFEKHPALSQSTARLILTAKTVFSSNTLLSQSMIDRPPILKLKH